MACGPDIRRAGARLDNLKIYDITPTILHMFGLPVHREMDGHVLTKVFKPESEPATRPVAYEQVNEGGKIKDRISQLKHLGKI